MNFDKRMYNPIFEIEFVCRRRDNFLKFSDSFFIRASNPSEAKKIAFDILFSDFHVINISCSPAHGFNIGVRVVNDDDSVRDSLKLYNQIFIDNYLINK